MLCCWYAVQHGVDVNSWLEWAGVRATARFVSALCLRCSRLTCWCDGAISCLRPHLDSPHSARAEISSTLGSVVAARVLNSLALPAQILAIPIFAPKLHSLLTANANDLASSLSAQGQHAAAAELLQVALESRRRVLGNDHPDTLATAQNLDTVRSKMRAGLSMSARTEPPRDPGFQDQVQRHTSIKTDSHRPKS